jgi:hypothetical protein
MISLMPKFIADWVNDDEPGTPLFPGIGPGVNRVNPYLMVGRAGPGPMMGERDRVGSERPVKIVIEDRTKSGVKASPDIGAVLHLQ